VSAATATIIALHPETGREAWDAEVAGYFTFLRVGRKSPNTIRSYGQSIEYFRRWLATTGRSQDPRDVTREDVGEWMLTLTGKPLTQRTRYITLATFFKWLASPDERVIEGTPFAGLKAPKAPDLDIPVIPPADLAALLGVVNGRSYEDRRDRAIILLMASTGSRRGEIAGLMLEDVDNTTGTVLLTQTKGERPRMARYGDLASEAMRHYLRARRDHPRAEQVYRIGARADTAREGLPLFLGIAGHGRGGTLGDKGIAAMLKRRCVEAGIKPINPHRFRHTWADGVLAAGMQEGDVMRLGGWKTPDMLRRYGASQAHARAMAHYLDPVDRMLKRR
jgi:site-specific recombinase XerD